MWYLNQFYFKYLNGFVMIIDIIIAQKKIVKVFFKWTYTKKLVYSLPASVRNTWLFLCLPCKNWDFSRQNYCFKVQLYDAKTYLFIFKQKKLCIVKKYHKKQDASVRDIYACPTPIKVKTTEFSNLGEQKIHSLHIYHYRFVNMHQFTGNSCS